MCPGFQIDLTGVNFSLNEGRHPFSHNKSLTISCLIFLYVAFFQSSRGYQFLSSFYKEIKPSIETRYPKMYILCLKRISTCQFWMTRPHFVSTHIRIEEWWKILIRSALLSGCLLKLVRSGVSCSCLTQNGRGEWESKRIKYLKRIVIE